MTIAAFPEPLGDGQFHFKVKAASGEVSDHAVDVISLRLACEEAEERHRLPKTEEGNLKPTAAFLADLAGILKQSAGLATCSPSLAYQLWTISGKLVDDLKKNTSETPSSVSGTDSTPPNSAEKSEPASTST